MHQTWVKLCCAKRRQKKEVMLLCSGLQWLMLHRETEADLCRPCLKTHICELEQCIRTLKRDLRKAQEVFLQKASEMSQRTNETSTENITEEQSMKEKASVDLFRPSAIATLSEILWSLIARLCARQSHLNTDKLGQLRFFDSTLSLHTAESVCSSFIH